MTITAPTKAAKVPALVVELQSICEEIADAKSRFADVQRQINSLEVGSFGTTFDIDIQKIKGLEHATGGIVDWTIGQLATQLPAINGPAIDNLRSGAK
jgi:hypothetical protein